MDTLKLTQEQVNELTDILRNNCSPSEFLLPFVSRLIDDGIEVSWGEIRLSGKLGFGCKLRFSSDMGFFISYYSEDHTKERDEIETMTNLALQSFSKSHNFIK
jgi:hypothetical protein